MQHATTPSAADQTPVSAIGPGLGSRLRAEELTAAARVREYWVNRHASSTVPSAPASTGSRRLGGMEKEQNHERAQAPHR